MKVAFLGTGLMGLPMAQRLLAADIQLVAYNRTPEKLAPLQAAGAEIVTDPRHAIRAAECIILMLTNASAIYNVLLSDTAWQTLEGRTIRRCKERSLKAKILAEISDVLFLHR